jgi:hypothetical protein
MGLNLGPSYGAGGYSDALAQILQQREMARRTAIMEQESQQRGQQQQIVADQLRRKTAIDNVGMQDVTPAQDIPYGQGEGPGGGPELVNVEDPATRAQSWAGPAPNIQTQNRFRATEIPGVAGSGPGMLRAKTAQEAAAAKRQSAIDEAMGKWVSTPQGGKSTLPIAGVEIKGDEKPDTRSPQQQYIDALQSGDTEGAKLLLGAIQSTNPKAFQLTVAGSGQAQPASFSQASGDKPSPDVAQTQFPGTGMSRSAVYQNGLQYALTGKMPSLGMGQGGNVAATRMAIQNQAAAIADTLGKDLPLLQAQYSSNRKSLDRMIPLYQQTENFASAAKMNLDNALQQSAKVPRTNSPMVNRYYQWAIGQNLAGDPALLEFENYIYTAAREYAKVVSGGALSIAALTDTAAKDAEKLMKASYSPEMLARAAFAMNRDMDNVMKAHEDGIARVSGGIAALLAPGGSPTGFASQPSAGPAAQSDAGTTWTRDANGKLVKKGG